MVKHQKQLRQKAYIFNELDEKIIENTDDKEILEAAVFDSADLQLMLPEKIALISHTLEVDSPRERIVVEPAIHDTIASHVRCLQSFGKSPKSLETLLVPMLLTKLPEETKKNMARDHATTTWTIEEFQAAILKELRIFKVGQQTSILTNQLAIPTAAFYTGAT